MNELHLLKRVRELEFQVRSLAEQRDEAEAKAHEARARLRLGVGPSLPLDVVPGVHLTPLEHHVLSCLYNAGGRRPIFRHILAASASLYTRDGRPRSESSVSVVVSKLRRKLAGTPIVIPDARGGGYTITVEGCEHVAKLVAERGP